MNSFPKLGPQSGILYFNINDPTYSKFDNFVPYPIEVEGKTWPTSEHYFQAKKYEGTSYEEMVRKAETPTKAKQLGRNPSFPLRSDWEEVKEEVMYRACLAKFSQHMELKKLLLGTGDLTIVEHAMDAEWGDGGDGSGFNKLGKVLMKVRAEIRGK